MDFVITGANRGIGLGLVRGVLALGHRVVATARNVAAASELHVLAQPGLELASLDVGASRSVEAFARGLGDRSIDVLINNAGVYGGPGDLEAFDAEDALATFRVNAVAPLELSRALLPALRRSRARKIVNISSRMASIAENTSGGAYAYRMSKAALNMATVSMAIDLAAEGFIVVAMNPGWVKTDMGGPGAPTSIEASVAGMLGQIERLRLEDSGHFVDYLGRGPIPW